MSIPLIKGARRVVVRSISWGELTPSWSIVGGECGDMVKSGEYQVIVPLYTVLMQCAQAWETKDFEK
jgi:hypothetical protein